MSKKTIYIVVKLELQRDVEITDNDAYNIVSELDYDFKSDDTNILKTEIVATHLSIDNNLL
jgi:hypothetical protein